MWFVLRQPSDYFASVLRTRQDYVAPTQGSLLNYVQRVPLGVVAQITVSNSYFYHCRVPMILAAFQPPHIYSHQENCSSISCWQLRYCQTE